MNGRCATLESKTGSKESCALTCLLSFRHDRRGKAADLKIDTEYIKLDSFLKATGMASSGGEAKLFITDGKVRVNGEAELRRGRKLHPGDAVEVAGVTEKVE